MQTDWYERREELKSGQVFLMQDGSKVELDRRVPGDGTKWYAATWSDYAKGFLYEDFAIEPGDLAELVTTY